MDSVNCICALFCLLNWQKHFETREGQISKVICGQTNQKTKNCLSLVARNMGPEIHSCPSSVRFFPPSFWDWNQPYDEKSLKASSHKKKYSSLELEYSRIGKTCPSVFNWKLKKRVVIVTSRETGEPKVSCYLWEIGELFWTFLPTNRQIWFWFIHLAKRLFKEPSSHPGEQINSGSVRPSDDEALKILLISSSVLCQKSTKFRAVILQRPKDKPVLLHLLMHWSLTFALYNDY